MDTCKIILLFELFEMKKVSISYESSLDELLGILVPRDYQGIIYIYISATGEYHGDQVTSDNLFKLQTRYERR